MSSHPGKSYPTFQLKISEEAIYSNASKDRLFGYAIEAPKGPIDEPTFIASNEEALQTFGIDFAPHFYQKSGGLIITRVGLPNAKSGSITYCVKTTSLSSSNASEESAVKYDFNSYNDSEGTTLWATGTVQLTGTVDGDYTEVKVLTNDAEPSFVGQRFYIISSATTDGTLYPLYTDAGTTPAGIYVSISESTSSTESEATEPSVTFMEAFTISAVDKGQSDIKVKVIESLGVTGGYTLIVDIPGVTSKTYNNLLTFRDIVKTINNKCAAYLKAEQKADPETHVLINGLSNNQELVVLKEGKTVSVDSKEVDFTALDDNDGILMGGSYGKLFKADTNMNAIKAAKQADGSYDESVLQETELSDFILYNGKEEDFDGDNVRTDITLTAAVVYKKAFDLMKGIDLIGVVTLSELDVVQSAMEDHIQECIDPEINILRFGVTSFLDYNNPKKQGFTLEDVQAPAILLNSEYFVYIGQGVVFKTDDGVKYDLPPHKAVMLYTGIRSALTYDTAIFGGEDRKILKGVVDVLPIIPGETLYKTDREELNENGVTTFKKEYDRVTFLEGVTTTQESDVLSYENIMSIVIYITKRLVTVAKAYQGKKMTEDLKESLKTALTSELRTIQQTDGCLIAIKDDEYDIPPYDVTVESAAMVRFNDNGELVRQSKIVAKVKIVPIGALRDIDLGVIVI